MDLRNSETYIWNAQDLKNLWIGREQDLAEMTFFDYYELSMEDK